MKTLSILDCRLPIGKANFVLGALYFDVAPEVNLSCGRPLW
jgi:hypothetical protein